MADQPNSVTVTLDVPIVRGEKKIENVQIRKPTTGALRGLKLADVVQADTDAMITLLPRITDPTLLPVEVERMDVADFIECSNQVSGFLPQRGANTDFPTA